MWLHAECANTGQKCGSIEYASSGSHAVVAGCLADPPSGAVGAQTTDGVHIGSLLDDAVQLGHGQVVERLTGDL